MPSTDYQTACCLIDGAYVRQRMDEIGVAWARVDLYKLAQRAVLQVQSHGWIGSPMALSRVYVYDAIPDVDMARGAIHAPNSVAAWLQRNDDLPDVLVRYGRLIEDAGGKKPSRQKAVDIYLAVDAVSLAFKRLCDVLVLVAGDGDYVPILDAVRENGPLVALSSFRTGLSSELAKAADRIGYFPTDIPSQAYYLFDGETV